MPQSSKLHPAIDAEVPALPYDENRGMGQVSRLTEQEREQSGNLPDSSNEDPARSDRPFKNLR